MGQRRSRRLFVQTRISSSIQALITTQIAAWHRSQIIGWFPHSE